MTGRPLELAETVFRLYQDLLRRRTGFVLADAQRSRLESRLGAEARSAGSFYQLYGRLRNEPADSPLFGRLLDAAVNGETYFFRDPASLRALAEEIGPEEDMLRPEDGDERAQEFREGDGQVRFHDAAVFRIDAAHKTPEPASQSEDGPPGKNGQEEDERSVSEKSRERSGFAAHGRSPREGRARIMFRSLETSSGGREIPASRT